ncbi:heparan sulfate 2-O-sulfotransferase 1 [Cephus cinctus]|uniref:Heparan sulfate 2-O-sulfotransferase 1 n=1 Tax=Cephus cinctus TaxID=211228 RepID=A0AAJ7RSB0_CEPCN|nr:heparan sulfate 2-O-sulfotransferase 1 [Cephus cinctus]
MRSYRAIIIVILISLTFTLLIVNVITTNDSGYLPVSISMRNPESTVSSYTGNDPQQTHRYVTPSLAELGGRGNLPPEKNDHVLMLTRVPGAGAEILVLILQRLQGYNAFKHIRLPPGDDGLLTSLQQELLVEEITSIIRQEAVPLSFDGDVRFLNFSAFGRQSPTYISLVRYPLDPRNLKSFRPGETRHGSILHFCGQDPRCTQRNSSWALEQAKTNVLRWCPVVGILEDIEVTLKVLENTFPYFFNGALEVYSKFRIPSKMKFDRRISMKGSKRKGFQDDFKMEMIFYEWLKLRLSKMSTNG